MLKWLDMDVSDVPELIAACCVLHNICKLHGEVFNEEWLEGVESQMSDCNSASATTVQLQESAVGIRSALTSYSTRQKKNMTVVTFKTFRGHGKVF